MTSSKPPPPTNLALPFANPQPSKLTDSRLPSYSKAINVPKEIPVELDLGLLAVFDPNPLEEEEYA